VRLTRVHVEAPLAPGEKVNVVGAAANHIARVLRLRTGDALTLFNGSGAEYGASIEEFRKDSVLVTVTDERQVERESPLLLTLAQGISRGERMDWILQKATELGVTRIVPVFTERSVVRLDARQAERKLQHWRGIAIAACEQCGRNKVPDLTLPVDIHEFLGDARETRAGTGASGGAGGTPMHLLLSPTAELGIGDFAHTATSVTVLIGPEGGLTDVEQESAIRAGFTPVRMGPRVLRTETAAIAALTVLQQEFGDL
jgi:16S rRNA (uracil1498-N3)-methyltransferase